MAWTSPKTWTADELLTASDLNQYVSDNLSALYALTQGGGRKNLLHNGAMQIHQRSTSVTSITGSQTHTADRWSTSLNALGTWTQSIENDAPTGSGFRKSLKMLCTTNDASPAAGDYLSINQRIEGQNLQSVLKGTTAAQQLTLSFWVKSNKTGVYVLELQDADNTRHAAAAYTVASSGTWEQHTVTIPADLTGAFDNDAAESLRVAFWLAAGSTYTSGTLATTWAATSNANSAVGQTNLAASNSNYWQVTGVQMEVGSAATGFEFQGYEQELSTCQRYYYKVAAGSGQLIGPGMYYSAGQLFVTIPLPTTMRAVPAFSNVTGASYFVTTPGSDAFNSLTIDSGSTATQVVAYNSTEAAGTAGYAFYATTNNASAVVALTADL